MQNYYTILGVSQTSTPAQIKKAYHKLAMQYHPDKNPNSKTAEASMKQINEAYATLSDSQLKYGHDQFLYYRINTQHTFSTTKYQAFTRTTNVKDSRADDIVKKVILIAKIFIVLGTTFFIIFLGALLYAVYKKFWS